MIRLGVAGAAGRMGGIILRLAEADRAFKISGAFEAPGNPVLGRLCGGVAISRAGIAAFKACDAVIDFTSPASTLENIKTAARAKTAMVIGTTGLDKKALGKVRAEARKIPVVFAPNMSVGANLLFVLAARAASALDGSYDLEVIEAHHRHKKDAPSGTAERLARVMAEARGWDPERCMVYGRKGTSGERPKKEIGVHVIRGGEIIGVHTAFFAGIGETLELSHRALSRDAFAKGALIAAKFVAKKKKGLFGMEDVLGI